MSVPPHLHGCSLALVCAMTMLAFAGCGDDGRPAPRTAPTAAAVHCPDGDRGNGFDANSLVGKRLGQAEAAAREHGCTVRPVEIDGEKMAVTLDLREDRINVVIEDDKVIDVKGVY